MLLLRGHPACSSGKGLGEQAGCLNITVQVEKFTGHEGGKRVNARPRSTHNSVSLRSRRKHISLGWSEAEPQGQQCDHHDSPC